MTGVSMANRDCTERRFREVLDRFGGPQRCLLVGEVWDRAESRDLLEGFLQTLFPGEQQHYVTYSRCDGPQEPVRQCDEDREPSSLIMDSQEPSSQCKGHQESTANSKGVLESTTHCKGNRGSIHKTMDPQEPGHQGKCHQPATDRSLRFPLVFFLCRAESLRIRKTRRLLREILRDLQERTRGGGAVIGVIVHQDKSRVTELDMTSGEQKSNDPSEEDPRVCLTGASPTTLSEEVASLLTLLHSVFPPDSRGGQTEVRAAALIQGQDETRKEIQKLACEAMTAAGEHKSQKSQSALHCFPWRRRRRKKSDPAQKAAMLSCYWVLSDIGYRTQHPVTGEHCTAAPPMQISLLIILKPMPLAHDGLFLCPVLFFHAFSLPCALPLSLLHDPHSSSTPRTVSAEFFLCAFSQRRTWEETEICHSRPRQISFSSLVRFSVTFQCKSPLRFVSGSKSRGKVQHGAKAVRGVLEEYGSDRRGRGRARDREKVQKKSSGQRKSPA
ncbi:uncharacterized protein C2orf72 homolog [Rhinophrynus dorsalis]